MRFLLTLWLATVPVLAADDPKTVLATVLGHLDDGDRFQAVEYVQRQGAPGEVAAIYSGLTRFFLRAPRDLDRFVFFSRAGIHYALTMAPQAEDPAQVDALRSAAKTLAYDLAAETWPGWGEEAAAPTAEQQAVGLDAARLNLRLARELGKGALKESYAYWMLGAHELAAGLHGKATASFDAAEKKAEEAGNPSAALSARGFLAVTRICAGDEAAGRAALRAVEEALAERAADGDEDASFLAAQFAPALAAFRKAE